MIKMPSNEFRRICTDLGQFGDSVSISCSKGDVRFEAQGDIGTGASNSFSLFFYHISELCPFFFCRAYPSGQEGELRQAGRGDFHRVGAAGVADFRAEISEQFRQGYSAVHHGPTVYVEQPSAVRGISHAGSWTHSVLFGSQDRRGSRLIRAVRRATSNVIWTLL